MAEHWLRAAAAHPSLRLVGLVDLRREAAERRRAEFAPEAKAGDDFATLLAELKPDLVFNCTVPSAHHPVTLAALRAGAHVLTEKPLADSLAQAEELASAAAAAKRLCAVTQNYRYQAAPRTVVKLLREGRIGQLVDLACDFRVGAHFGGFREEMAHPLLLDMSIHHFDLARLFLGDVAPARVFCHEFNPQGSWYRHGAAAQAIFEFPDRTVFNYQGSWCAEGADTPWPGRWRLTGTQGTLSWDGASGLRLSRVLRAAGFLSELEHTELPVLAAPGQDAAHADIIAEFVRCIQNKDTPETGAAANLASLAMVLGAVRSAETRSLIELS
jgi:predicted dehydrogenase